MDIGKQSSTLLDKATEEINEYWKCLGKSEEFDFSDLIRINEKLVTQINQLNELFSVFSTKGDADLMASYSVIYHIPIDKNPVLFVLDLLERLQRKVAEIKPIIISMEKE